MHIYKKAFFTARHLTQQTHDSDASYGPNVHLENGEEWTDGNALENDMERGTGALQSEEG